MLRRVYGSSLESSLVAVVVPDKRALQGWASSAGVAGSFEELCQSDKARPCQRSLSTGCCGV